MENKKRLIDANALKRWTCEWCNKTRPEEPCEPGDCAIMLFYDGQPTVDAVEVVRCKDCRHAYKGIANIMCGRSGQIKGDLRLGGVSVKDDHFCSYGERREGE